MEEKRQLVRFDWAIKNLLRDKSNFDILEGFLGALLEDDDLKIIGLLSEEGNQEDADDKFNRVDLMVEDSKKQQIIIEVQTTRESNYLERLLFGASKVITEKIGVGDKFKNVKKVISVSILFFNLGSGSDYLYHGSTKFVGMNDGKELVLRRKEAAAVGSGKKYQLKNRNIFPEYYLIRVEKYQNIVKKKIDEWIYLIKNNEVKTGSKAKGIKQAEKKLDIMNMSKAERKRYERFMINLARELDMFETAREDGIKEGIETGIEVGEVFQKLKNLLKIIEAFPKWSAEQIAFFTEIKSLIVEELLLNLKTKNTTKINAVLQNHFLKKIRLSKDKQYEINALIEKIIQ